jgi:cytochrome c biogenesis protein CcmG, thiol:disulfide interchange protein DsbE
MITVRQLTAAASRALPWVVMLAGIVWFSDGMRPGAAFEVGGRLPALSVRLHGGQQLDLAEPPGRPMVLNFWASYCGPCRAEAPILAALHERGAYVVGLSVDARSPAQLMAAAHDFGMPYPVGLAGSLVTSMRVRTIPTTYVLDAAGKIMLSRTGAVSARDLDRALAVAAQSVPGP